jgi:ATP-dependent DNA helicase DinG
MVGALRLSLEYDHVPGLVNDVLVTRNVDNNARGRAVRTNHRLFTELSNEAQLRDERRWGAPLEVSQADALAVHLNSIHGQLKKRYPPVPGASEGNEENAQHQRVLEWAGELQGQVEALGRPVPEDAVRYCQRIRGDSAQARVGVYQEPIEVAGFLQKALWEGHKTVVCTTATLSVNQRFDYFRWQTGAPQEGVYQRIIPSPFDFAQQSLLYTPHGLVPVYGEGEDQYAEDLAREVDRLVRASRGRAFVLCTSWRRAKQLHERLEPFLPFTCHCQGQAPRSKLLDLFRGDSDGAILFATKSFWEGVDVPGQALSLVIIDKLPFAPHLDPVIQRRSQRVREAGGNPFAQYSLPEATLALKQGVGRLIRNETDRGVMAILDSRINTKRYGYQMVASLPPARRTFEFKDVEDFFA